MANFISERKIQEELAKLFINDLKYDVHIECEHKEQLNRKNQKEVVDKTRLKTALYRINNHLDKYPSEQKKEAINEAIRTMTRNRSALGTLAANKEIHLLLKKGIRLKLKDNQGKEEEEKIIFLDFHTPENNHFLVAEEVWIENTKRCRTDILIYINGLPLVFFELKNSNVEVKTAYESNLNKYKKHIPQLFYYNAFILLSNGIHTKVGSVTATYEHFNDWQKILSEKETNATDRDSSISLVRATKGMCDKKRLLDIIENFIFYFSDSAKVVAKNHQYIGVNNAITSFENRLTQEGKLGVFWHTQGSGKSFSMIFFTMKIFQKYVGDYTFLIVTDRENLDQQIYKNFLSSEIVTEKDEAQATSRDHLREMLGGSNKRFVFTLIQKFGIEKGETYPLLSERDDIIVLVDEAHRSQYNTFGQNMRNALPNANFLAFTGTPLLDANETTKEWFGEYVSKYNFAQSIEDGATVPLFYENRVPEVQLGNKNINEDLAEISEKDNLTDAEDEKLKRQYTKELELIKREDRLDVIAEDIVKHFPYRDYQGKGMVISIDKYTTVKMYDKVQNYWKAEIRELHKQINRATTPKEKAEKQKVLNFMREAEMYVVISEESGEEEKFLKENLNIKPHREAINKRFGTEKLTLRDRFQKDEDPFSLVFVCSKWLTGFDSPTISTLYVDKPMQNHTLMQTIARANRVSSNKTCGMIIDYFGVFENLEKALEKYGKSNNPDLKDDDKPVKNKTALEQLLKDAIDLGKAFMLSNGCDIELILNSDDTFKNIQYFGTFGNTISQTEELKKEFNVHENAIRNLYQATQPDKQVSDLYKRTKEVFEYLRPIINPSSKGSDYETAVQETRKLLDTSIYSDGYVIKPKQEIDLRNINLERVEENFKKTNYKYLSINDLAAFLEDELQRMLNVNTTRTDFAVQLQKIIDRYNAKGSSVSHYFEELKAFTENLRNEDLRHVREGLTEKELEIFDLILNGDKLSKKVKQTVKLAAQHLLTRLKEEQEKVLQPDWHKDQRQRINVERYVMKELYPHLTAIYDNDTFVEKSKVVYHHIFEQAQQGMFRA
jgi:type I restriction enzyme R subunit